MDNELDIEKKYRFCANKHGYLYHRAEQERELHILNEEALL